MTLAATHRLEQAAELCWDVLVIGAGPAGAFTARACARAGLTVLLVDRTAFPRWKVCGSCLNARALAILHAVGLGELTVGCGAVALDSVLLAAGPRRARLSLPAGIALSRERFDAALVHAALAAGAAFMPATTARLGEQDAVSRRVLLQQGSAETTATARVVIAATGLNSRVTAGANGRLTRAERGSRIGAGAIADLEQTPAAYRPGTIYMACGSAGYLGLVRLEDGRLDLAAALDAALVKRSGGLAASAATILAEVGWPAVPALAELDWRGTPALTRRSLRLARSRLFLVGDAAGYVEPFTGEGIAWALASALELAPLVLQAVQGWQPALEREWTRRYRRVVTRRQLACRVAAKVLRHPALAEGCIALLAYVPALAAPLLRFLNAPISQVKVITP